MTPIKQSLIASVGSLGLLTVVGCQLFVGSEDPKMQPIDAAPDSPVPPCPDDMVEAQLIGAASVCIDRYEASHSAADPALPVSIAGAMPWVDINHADAEAACNRAGKRLCRNTEWNAACEGGSETNVYPYGESFSYVACNGAEANWDEVLATGSLATCEGGLSGLFDMAGNVAEWLAECGPATSSSVHCTAGEHCCALASSSFDDGGQWVQQCQLWGPGASAGYYWHHIGFRCCRDVATESERR
ncbi:MAG: formylglycine-generating enzyme family protein [Kofleriaceae bacterium]